jgi:hypothetical protein
MPSSSVSGFAARKGSSDQTSGLVLGAGALLSIFLMAHHPTAGSTGLVAAVGEIARKAALSRFVHGGLIACMGLVLLGLVGLSDALGWRLARVRLAMMAYASGFLALAGAALVNGFIVEGLAERYLGAPDGEMEGVRDLLRLCFETNQTLARAGVMGFSAGILCWSLVLLQRAGWAKGIGALGLAAGVLPAAGLLTGHLRLHLHGMTAVVLAQAVWYVAVAAWLLRGEAPPGGMTPGDGAS